VPDVLIFEDDPSIGDLAADILRAKGLSVGHYLSGAGVVQLVAETRPKLVVLDIMMPGMDGLSACRAIRANTVTKAVKIAILTAKNNRTDRDTATRFGADLFLNKPFDSQIFARAVGQLMGFPADPDPQLIPQPPAPPVAVSLLRGAAAMQAGDAWTLFDAGPGLDEWVHRQHQPPGECWVLLSRYQPEALSELKAGGSLLITGARVKLAGPDDAEGTLQLTAPKMLAGLPTAKRTPLLYPQRENEFQLAPGVLARSVYTQHPGTTLAYRVDLQGKSIVYCPAHEINPDPQAWQGHENGKFRSFFGGADLLLHGFRRSLTQPRAADEKGAGAWEPIIDLAAEAGTLNLVLFPLPGAQVPATLPEQATRRAAEKSSTLRVTVAHGPQRFVL
jgi:CheY-like chemotaxis protein